jgi:hypothetical protein
VDFFHLPTGFFLGLSDSDVMYNEKRPNVARCVLLISSFLDS